MSITKSVHTDRPTGVGRQIRGEEDVIFPAKGADRTVALVGILRETVPIASFADGGGAAGTYLMAGSLPRGALVLGTKVLVPGAFAGDTSAVAVIGDGSDVDRYMTGTLNVFAALPNGVEAGVPSGAKLLTSENHPTITVTSAADIGLVITDDGGSITVEIAYIEP